MDRSLDRHEQCSGRNCHLPYSVKETKKENTDNIITEI